MIAMPRESAMQLTIARRRFFHQGRTGAPVSTSSASNIECTPLDASQTKVSAAMGATAPPFHAATLASSFRRRSAADGGSPVVIAEMSTELPQLTVGEAVMRLDLADAPVLLFRNRAHGELNLLYRRGDGNIGWIDPAAPGRKGAGRA